LATTETQKVLETIISRCQRYDFKRISKDVMVERLKFISKNE
jgi:DNA polymerase-3 subunit gamma/tau